MAQQKQSPAILALDLSAARTGWAHTNGDFGSETFELHRGESPGMRWVKFRAWLGGLLDELPADVIAYEQAHHRGGAPTHCAHSLIGIVEMIAAERGIELTNRHTAKIKLHATGKGNADKAMMIAAAREHWDECEIEFDDEADALWLLDLVKLELGAVV